MPPTVRGMLPTPARLAGPKSRELNGAAGAVLNRQYIGNHARSAENRGRALRAGQAFGLWHDAAVSLLECLHEVKGARRHGTPAFAQDITAMRPGPARGSVIPVRIGDRSAGTYIARMCGRFTHRYTWADIHRLYRLTSPASNVQPSYNVCPTDIVNVVTSSQDVRILQPLRWGLIPHPLHYPGVGLTNGRTRRTANSRTISRAPTAK